METRIAEIADGVFRLSSFVPEVAPPAGFTFNQFLLAADEPLLFHSGHRAMFPQIAEAVFADPAMLQAQGAVGGSQPERGQRGGQARQESAGQRKPGIQALAFFCFSFFNILLESHFIIPALTEFCGIL